MTIRLQLILGFSVLILIFLVDFFVNQRLSKAVLTNTSYISNSEAVIRNSNLIHKEMIEMQSGFRGFLLTSQESFLQPYYEGLGSVPRLIKEQKKLIEDEQSVRLDTIDLLHRQWVEYADSLISAKRDTLPSGSQNYQRLFENKLKMEVGKKLNDRIRDFFLLFDTHEYRIRQERRAALQLSIEKTRNITLALTIVSILLAILSSLYFVRSVGSRISRMVNLAERISDGNFISITDTRSDEFTRLVESLNKMSETLDKNFKELTKKNNELDQFAYVVSHDLKAPLRGISNIISWIEEDHEHELTPDIRINLSLIKGRTERLENMINGLLEYARIGKVKKSMEEIDTMQLLYELSQLLVPANFRIEIQDNIPPIIGEKFRVEQVFSNLISNAVKYNKKEHPLITISSRDLPGFYEFSVSDNGPGIEREYFDKIFVIFQTLKERDAFESTGVGLAIVKKIIEDNKGNIKVESEPGKGATFTFTWPKEPAT